jgi:hypothetical protein
MAVRPEAVPQLPVLPIMRSFSLQAGRSGLATAKLYSAVGIDFPAPRRRQ